MAFDYSSVKNKKRKDEKTSGFNYSSVVGRTERTDEEKREYVRQQNAQKNDVRNRPDYAVVSKKGRTNYENFLNEKTETGFGNWLSKTDAAKVWIPSWDRYTEDEKNMYGYLLETDKEKARDYMLEINRAYQDADRKKVTDQVSEWAEDRPFFASAASLVANIGAPVDYIKNMGTARATEFVDGEATIMPSAGPSGMATAMQKGVQKRISENTDLEVMGANVASQLYGMGMSVANSAALIASMGPLAVVEMSMQAASSATMEALDRGVSDTQAVQYGTAAGVAEALAEYVSIEHLFKLKTPHTVKQAIKSALAQAGIEASEEATTTVINAVSDFVINGDKSEYATQVAFYLSEGYSQKEAEGKATWDSIKGLAWDAIGGAVSGLLLGGGSMALESVFGNTEQRNAEKTVKSLDEDKSAVIDYAMNAKEGSEVRKAAEDIKARTEKGEKVSDKEYADILMKADDNFAATEIKKQIAYEAEQNGETYSDEELGQMSTNVLKTMRGDFISESDNDRIEKSKAARNVYARNTGREYTYGEAVGKAEMEQLNKNERRRRIEEFVGEQSDAFKKTLSTSYESYKESGAQNLLDEEEFADEFSTFYDYGKAGIVSVNEIFKTYPAVTENPMLKNSLEQAYVLGRGEAVTANKANIENRQAEIDAKLQVAKGKNVASVGQVRLATEAELSNPKVAAVGGKVVTKGKKLSKQHRATMQFVREFAKLSGINVVLYEGGKSRGWYDSVNNEIFLNIEEGMNLKTLSHELTHFIQQHSPKQYEEFKQFLLDYYKENGKYQELLEQAHSKQQDLSAEELEDEIVANACQMFISDTEAMQKLIDTQSKGLIETITRWFRNMCDYLRQAFEGVKASHAAAQALEEDIEMLERARDKWYELLNESITVSKQIGANAKNQVQNYDESKQQFEYKESEADYHRNLAVKEFGYTPYFYDAGYILPNGKMLNFSGEKGRHYGSRGEDHRAIGTIFIGDISGSEAMVKFMHEGNIRIMAESPAVDFASNQVPTSEQYATIKKFIRQYAKEEYFSVDFTDERGYTIGSYEYEDNISAERIVNDIKYYFEHGETREQSDVSRFHFEMKDSEGNELSPEQVKFFKNSKVRNENGNLTVVYHGTRKADFTVFNRNFNFFTDSKETADSYAPNGEKFQGYLDIKKPFIIDAKGEKWSKVPIDSETKNLLDRYGSSSFKEEGKWRSTPADIVYAIMDGIDEGEFDYDGVIVKNVDDTGSYFKEKSNVVANDYIAFNSNQFKNLDNKAPTKDPDIRFEIKEDFYKEYDAWDKKDTHKKFIVGTTSEVLRAVGMKNQNIVLRAGTVLSKINKHQNEVDFDTFRDIPNLLEKPIIVQFSDDIDQNTGKQKYDSRITVLGELYGKNGKPILVSLELLPTKKDKTISLDFALITSAYEKNALQDYLNRNSILYIEPNKKRTSSWLSRTKLSLPFGENQYGSIRKIAYSDGKVKVQKSKNATAIQKAMEEAGVVDDYGNFKFELKDEDENRLEILENQEERLVNDLKTLEKYYGDAIRQVYEQDIKPNESISKRAEELKRKAARRFMNEVGAMFHVPKDTREEYLLPIINEIIDKGPAISDSEGLIDRLYQTAYEHTEDYIVDTDPEGNYKNLRDYIRKTSIFVNAGTKADVGDYNNFRKRNMGSLRLTNDQTALGLDEFYEEVSNLAPEIFTGTTDGAEQLYELSSFMKDRGRTESIGDFMPQAEYTAWADETLEPELNKLFDSTIGSFLFESTRKERERKRAAKVDRAMENVTGAIKNYKAAQNKARAEGVLVGQIEQGKKMSAEMRRMQESFERKAKNYEDMIEAKRAKIKEIRQRRDEILEERRQAFEAYREKRNNTIRNGALRKRIERTVKKLNDKLLKPKDIKHIPEDLKEATAALLENFVNDTSVFPKAKLDDLREAYDNIRTSGRDLEELYDEDIANNIKSLKETIGGKRLSELNTEQLKEIYEVVASISHMVSDGNKLFINGRKQNIESFVEDIQVAAMEHGSKKKASGLLGKPVNYADKYFNYDNIIPPYFFDDIGGGLKKLYDDMLYNGGLVWTQDINDSQQFMADIFEKYHVWDWTSKNIKNKDKVFKFKSERGFNIELTTNEALSVYATYKRGMANGDGAAHLMQGGIVVDLKENNGILSFKSESQKGKPLTVEDIQKIMGFLTEEQMECADKIVEYLTVVDGEKRNETSMQLHGYKKFNEKYYFPYHVDSSFVKHEPGQPIEEKGKTQSVTRLKNMGSSKVLTPHANAAVHIGDFFDVVAQSMEETASYHGYALVQDNFMRVLNYKNTVDKEGFEGSSGVAQAIKDAYGNEAYNYINKLMGDIFGGPVQIEKDMLMGMFNNFKKTSVVANLSVTVQQPSAVVRAITEIEPKYLFKTFGQRKNRLNEMFGYSSTAFLKNMGRFDVGTGFTAQQYILKPNLNTKEYLRQTVVMNSKYDTGARDDALGYLTEKADWTTWGWIMNAAWAKIEAETDLEPGSKEFKKVVGKLFDQITNKTQVYDSVLVKSPLARSKNVATQMSAAFMNEPILSYNLVMDGFKHPGKKLGIALTAHILSQVANAFLWSFIGALRDDDEDKTYGEKYVKAFTSKFLTNIIPFLNLPYINQIISALKGFDVENMAYSPITDAIEAFEKAQKKFYQYDYAGGFKELTVLFNLVGLPVRNIVRDFGSFIAFDSAPIGSASANDIWEAAVEGFNEALGIKESKTDGIKSAMRGNKNDKIRKEVQESIKKYKDEGKTEKQAKQYIKTSLTSYWKPIYIANEDKRADIRKAIFATGLYGSANDVIKTCNNWLENE